MSGRYLYCQNEQCGCYLGSLGGNFCPICDWSRELDDNEIDYGVYKDEEDQDDEEVST